MSDTKIEITTTDNLDALQRRRAAELSMVLPVQFVPSTDLASVSIHCRPANPLYADQENYYPARKHLLVYWGLSPGEDLANALKVLADHLPALEIDASGLADLLRLGAPPVSAQPRTVHAFWTGPYHGEQHWLVRQQSLPQSYPRVDVATLARFLNRHAIPPAAAHELQGIALTYRLYHTHPHPDDGFLHYRHGDGLLLIEVPIQATDLARLLDPPADQRWMLGAMLLSFLGLQHDPGVPGLDFPVWRRELERAFREEGFWDGTFQ